MILSEDELYPIIQIISGDVIDPWGIPPMTGLQLVFHVADDNYLSLRVFSPLPTLLALHLSVNENVMEGAAEGFAKIEVTHKIINIQYTGTSERQQVMLISQKKCESFPRNTILTTVMCVYAQVRPSSVLVVDFIYFFGNFKISFVSVILHPLPTKFIHCFLT